MSLPRYFPVVVLIVVGLVLSACSLGRGPDYPSREVTFIVPYGPGGGADLVSRAIAPEAEPLLKQKIVVVNKPSPGGTAGVAEVVQARPDGYTIGLALLSATALQPLLDKLPWDTPDDYQPIIKLTDQSAVLAVKADSPWKTLDDFLAEARKRPGQIRIATGGQLSLLHLTAERVKQTTRVDVTVVPMAGAEGEAIRTLLGGHVEALVVYSPPLSGQIQAGQVRVLAAIQEGRNPLVPDVPSIKELGYAIKMPTTQFIIGPKGLDKGVVDKLNKTFNDAVKTPKFQDFAKKSGLVLDPLGPTDLAKEIMEYRKVIAELLRELKVETKK